MPESYSGVQIASMDDDMTMPEGWASHTLLPAAPWTDTSIYELHIRDFRYIRSRRQSSVMLSVPSKHIACRIVSNKLLPF